MAESLKRWIIFLARIGGVLVAISLAFYLASFIPRGSLYPSSHSELLLSGKFNLDATPSLYAINPQLGMKIIFTTNKTLRMQVFSLNYSDVEKWLNDRNQNATVLAEFEAAYSGDLILRQNISSGATTFEYFPPKIENATVIVLNPTPHVAAWSFNEEDVEAIATPGSFSLALIIATSLGVVLILPWLTSTLKEKRRKESPT